MDERRAAAKKLRMAGQSYNEIQRALNISKSTLSSWFRDLVLSSSARNRLQQRSKIGTDVLIKRNKMQTHTALQRAHEVQLEAVNEVDDLTVRDKRLVGIALYWAEGYKRLRISDGKERAGHPISFVNSDAEMAGFFVQFLVETMNVPRDKIRVGMRLYNHMNEEGMLKFWTSAIGLPRRNFHKTTWLVSISSQRKRPFNRLPHGTIQIQVSDTAKFHRLIGWIEGMKRKLSYGSM